MRRRNVGQAESGDERLEPEGGGGTIRTESKVGSAPPAIDAQSFRTLYQENLGVVYRFVYSKVGNREEAEDLTSQVFLKAVRGLDREQLYTRGYWKLGVSDHPDHDTGEE